MTFDPAAAAHAVYDSAVLDLGITLAAYQFGLWLYHRHHRHPLLLPVMVGLVLVVGACLLLRRDFATYHAHIDALYVLLGPVTVALAVPLYRHVHRIRQLLLPLMITGAVTAVAVTASSVGLMALLGSDHAAQMSLAPKAATTPIAILIADAIDGIPALAAVCVMLTGIIGAIVGPPLIDRLGIRDDAARGFALGLSAHAVGTARAFEISHQCGAFAALGMSLMGTILAVSLPLILGG